LPVLLPEPLDPEPLEPAPLVPEPVLPEPVEPEPVAPELELPLVLGELLEGLLLGEELLLPVPPVAAPLSFLKWSSHSCREICPSLFLSTDENSGVLALAPADPVPPAAALPDALGVELEPDALGVELEPDALGVELEPDDELPPEAEEPLEALSDELPLEPDALGEELMPPEDELELCATATLDRAKSAAAVAALMSFRVIRCCLLYLVVSDDPLLTCCFCTRSQAWRAVVLSPPRLRPVQSHLLLAIG
jgi:hypothetical protein